jgi:mono/diheme cytochrome c family protein
MFRKLLIFIPLAAFVLFFSGVSKKAFIATTDSPVAETLEQLGDDPLPHKPDLSVPGASVKKGEELVLTGITEKPGGGKTSKQSKNFVCTACHNLQREDPDLRVSDPQARLEYTKENGMPFLPGTTLYGAVNRTSFYNGFYEKKYGDLVYAARNDLREAIQLCATQCSQGRLYEDWELESVLAYLWTLELKLSDLNLSEEQFRTINNALQGEVDPSVAIELIKSRYLAGSPATFAYPPENRREGYDKEGDAANGKLIYEMSCLHCHEEGRFAFFSLDNSKHSFKFLKKHIPVYTRYSIYQVARWGTSPVPGKHTYMPNYTQEKLSDQQMEDLRAYIEQQVEG